eukprot:gene16725-biopygen3806
MGAVGLPPRFLSDRASGDGFSHLPLRLILQVGTDTGRAQRGGEGAAPARARPASAVASPISAAGSRIVTKPRRRSGGAR